MRTVLAREALHAAIGALSAVVDAVSFVRERLCERADLIPRHARDHAHIFGKD